MALGQLLSDGAWQDAPLLQVLEQEPEQMPPELPVVLASQCHKLFALLVAETRYLH